MIVVLCFCFLLLVAILAGHSRMASFGGKGNAQLLEEAEAVQDKTKESILRMKQQTAESEEIGQATLEELRRQGELIDENIAEVEQIDEKLNKASSLQNEFDRWAAFGGYKCQQRLHPERIRSTL